MEIYIFPKEKVTKQMWHRNSPQMPQNAQLWWEENNSVYIVNIKRGGFCSKGKPRLLIAAPSSRWLRPAVASVTQQATLNQIRDSDFEERGRRVRTWEEEAVLKAINGAVGRVACYQHGLWGDVQLVCRLLNSLNRLSGTGGQTLRTACRARHSLIPSYSFL